MALTASSSSLTALNARPHGELLKRLSNKTVKNIDTHAARHTQACEGENPKFSEKLSMNKGLYF